MSNSVEPLGTIWHPFPRLLAHKHMITGNGILDIRSLPIQTVGAPGSAKVFGQAGHRSLCRALADPS